VVQLERLGAWAAMHNVGVNGAPMGVDVLVSSRAGLHPLLEGRGR